MDNQADNLSLQLTQFADQLPAGYGNGQVIPCGMSRLEIRAAIQKLEAEMRTAQDCGEIEKTDINDILPLQHFHAPGTYGRQIILKKMNWAIGKIHRHAHLNFVIAGKALVLTEDGLMVITAPYTFVSTVGAKRFVMALEDTIWATVHATNETDLGKIEADVIATDYDTLGIIENLEQEKLS